MSSAITFGVYVTPAGKGSMAVNTSTGRVFPTNSKAQKEFASAIKSAAKEKCPVVLFGQHTPVRCDILFMLKRGATVHRKYPAVTPDIDKLTRTVYDALTGVVWHDDGQVCAGMIRKIYAVDKDKPNDGAGVIISVSEIDDD